jgi:hypothetical protein
MTFDDLKEFENVTIYTNGDVFGNINRVDVKKARVWIAPYAQYKTAVFLEFIRRGKRKPEYLVRAGNVYIVIVSTDMAIDPDELYVPVSATASAGRYTAADPRWRSDFDSKLSASQVPILADYRFSEPVAMLETSSQASSLVQTELPQQVNNGAIHNSEFEEGVRYSAERFFFERNSALADRARQHYGCICQVCEFDFVGTYGEIGKDFAEVHHLNPLSERPQQEWTQTVLTDLSQVAVVCANCHRMVHRRKPALSLEELRSMLKK